VFGFIQTRFFFITLLLGAALLGQSNPPRIATSGVVNAGDYTPVLAPGMHMSVFGFNLASTTKIAETAPVPEVLDGVSIEVVHAGRPMRAPLVFVSPGQINAQVPYEVAGPEIVVRVRTSAGVSNEVAVRCSPAPRGC
jgi:uncharacterized protein (TIGR03437 family)